jgi:hypothetical protein
MCLPIIFINHLLLKATQIAERGHNPLLRDKYGFFSMMVQVATWIVVGLEGFKFRHFKKIKITRFLIFFEIQVWFEMWLSLFFFFTIENMYFKDIQTNKKPISSYYIIFLFIYLWFVFFWSFWYINIYFYIFSSEK